MTNNTHQINFKRENKPEKGLYINKNTLLGFSRMPYTPSVTCVVRQLEFKSVDDNKYTKSLDISRLFSFCLFFVI